MHRGQGVDQVAGGCVGAARDTAGRIFWGPLRQGLECQAKGITSVLGAVQGPDQRGLSKALA